METYPCHRVELTGRPMETHPVAEGNLEKRRRGWGGGMRLIMNLKQS